MTATLLLADRLWDGVATSPADKGFVAVEEGRITAVGQQADIGSAFDAHTRVELPGCTLMPGLINGHAHMTFSASPIPVEDYLREAGEGTGGIATLTMRAVANLGSAARAGVTTVRDLGTLNEVAFPVRAAAEQGDVVLPRIVASGRPITVTGGHCHWFSHQCDTPAEIRKAVRLQVSSGADLIKIFATGGNLTPRTNPYAPQYTEDELRACVEEAQRLGVPVAAHAHAPEGIRRAVAAGVTTIEHCFFETPDSVQFDATTAERMAAAGIAFCPTAGANLLELLAHPPPDPNPVLARLISKMDLFRATFRALLAAGVPLLAGSDAGIPMRFFGNYPADVAALCSETLLGISPQEALMAATSRAATLMGLSDTGRLAPGLRADVLAVEGDPLDDVRDVTRTRLVLVGGRLVPR